MEEKIIEGNKRIAEFLGYKRNDDYSEYFPRLKHWLIEGFGWFDDKDLHYHDNWQWLMPVCIKLGLEFVSTDINKTYNDVIRMLEVR